MRNSNNNNDSLKIKNSENSTDIYIVGEIGWDFTEEDLVEQLQNHKPDINLYISSGGGSVFSGWAMMSALQRTDAHITANIDGLCASMATGIAMVADKVKMTDNGIFMIHNASGFVWGNKQDMRKTAELLDKIDSVITNTYVKATGKSKDEIIQMMNDETWLTPDEALENGFVHELVEMVNTTNCAGGCKLIAENKFGYKNIPTDKIEKMKEIIQNKINDEEKINTLTKKQIDDDIKSLKSRLS